MKRLALIMFLLVWTPPAHGRDIGPDGQRAIERLNTMAAGLVDLELCDARLAELNAPERDRQAVSFAAYQGAARLATEINQFVERYYPVVQEPGDTIEAFRYYVWAATLASGKERATPYNQLEPVRCLMLAGAL